MIRARELLSGDAEDCLVGSSGLPTYVHRLKGKELRIFREEDNEALGIHKAAQRKFYLDYDRVLQAAKNFGAILHQQPNLLDGLGVTEPITKLAVAPFQLGSMAFHAIIAIHSLSSAPKYVVAYISRFPLDEPLLGDLAHQDFQDLRVVYAGIQRANHSVRSRVGSVNPEGITHLNFQNKEYPVFFTPYIEDANELHVRFLTVMQGSQGGIELPIYHFATGQAEVNDAIVNQYDTWITQFIDANRTNDPRIIMANLLKDQFVRHQIRQQIMLVECCTLFWLAANKQFPKGFGINSGDFMAKFNSKTRFFDFVYLITTRGGLAPIDEEAFTQHMLSRRSGLLAGPTLLHQTQVEQGHDLEVISGIFSSLNEQQVRNAIKRAQRLFAKK